MLIDRITLMPVGTAGTGARLRTAPAYHLVPAVGGSQGVKSFLLAGQPSTGNLRPLGLSEGSTG